RSLAMSRRTLAPGQFGDQGGDGTGAGIEASEFEMLVRRVVSLVRLRQRHEERRHTHRLRPGRVRQTGSDQRNIEWLLPKPSRDRWTTRSASGWSSGVNDASIAPWWSTSTPG